MNSLLLALSLGRPNASSDPLLNGLLRASGSKLGGLLLRRLIGLRLNLSLLKDRLKDLGDLSLLNGLPPKDLSLLKDRRLGDRSLLV